MAPGGEARVGAHGSSVDRVGLCGARVWHAAILVLGTVWGALLVGATGARGADAGEEGSESSSLKSWRVC